MVDSGFESHLHLIMLRRRKTSRCWAGVLFSLMRRSFSNSFDLLCYHQFSIPMKVNDHFCLPSLSQLLSECCMRFTWLHAKHHVLSWQCMVSIDDVVPCIVKMHESLGNSNPFIRFTFTLGSKKPKTLDFKYQIAINWYIINRHCWRLENNLKSAIRKIP